MKYKRYQMLIILCALCTLVLAACGSVTEDSADASEAIQSEEKTELTGDKSNTEQEPSDNGSNTEQEAQNSDLEAQLAVMADHKELWMQQLDYADDLVQYAVTDLDGNGNYELIVSQFGGTGQYTYSRFYEMTESGDELKECGTNFAEGDSQPDIMQNRVTVYQEADGSRVYMFLDYLKNGAAEYYESRHGLKLQDGQVTDTVLAGMACIMDGDEPVVTYQNTAGDSITEEEYLQAEYRAFPDQERSVAVLGWQSMEELEGLDRQQIIEQLKISAQQFAIEEEEM